MNGIHRTFTPPETSRTMEEDISRTVGDIKTQGKAFDFVGKTKMIQRINDCMTS